MNGADIYAACWNNVILVSVEQCRMAPREEVDLFTNYDEVVQILHMDVGKNPRQLSYADMRTRFIEMPMRDDRRADERRHDQDPHAGKRRRGREDQPAEAPNASTGSGLTAEERAQVPTTLPIPSRRAEQARPRDERPAQQTRDNDATMPPPAGPPLVGGPAETPHPPLSTASAHDEAEEVSAEPGIEETTEVEAHQVPLPDGDEDLGDDDPKDAGAESGKRTMSRSPPGSGASSQAKRPRPTLLALRHASFISSKFEDDFVVASTCKKQQRDARSM